MMGAEVVFKLYNRVPCSTGKLFCVLLFHALQMRSVIWKGMALPLPNLYTLYAPSRYNLQTIVHLGVILARCSQSLNSGVKPATPELISISMGLEGRYRPDDQVRQNHTALVRKQTRGAKYV